MHYFAAACRVAYMYCVLEIEMFSKGRQVIRVVIHVVAITGLRGSPMPTPVVGYNAVPMIEEKKHVCIPVIGRKRPAVRKNNRLSGSPILVVNRSAILNCNCAHVIFSRRGRAARRCGV